jgi:hypothetical protein
MQFDANITYKAHKSSLKETGNKEKKTHASQWSEQSVYFTAHYCCQDTGTGFTGRLKIMAHPQGQSTAEIPIFCIYSCFVN